MMRPCIGCGEPSSATRCPKCRPQQAQQQRRRGSARKRGYSTSWDKLSQRARKLQPFCAQCGTPDDLTVDHLPSAWERHAEGKPIRLSDVAVLCTGCNSRAGSSRPGTPRALAHTRGDGPPDTPVGPLGEAERALHGAEGL